MDYLVFTAFFLASGWLVWTGISGIKNKKTSLYVRSLSGSGMKVLKGRNAVAIGAVEVLLGLIILGLVMYMLVKP